MLTSFAFSLAYMKVYTFIYVKKVTEVKKENKKLLTCVHSYL